MQYILCAAYQGGHIWRQAIQRDPDLLGLAKWDFEKTNDSMWKHLGQIWDRLRKFVKNSFTASVERHARASVNVMKLVSNAQVFVNVNDTVTNGKGIK